ncbi:MAG: tripartite tricarboxylate transporter substrate binding protein [Betaproteobacteria bacterium]|nr:tripartite tricarboxylate transporter substrate binding protein [Betaproteobacteria bacterium]
MVGVLYVQSALDLGGRRIAERAIAARRFVQDIMRRLGMKIFQLCVGIVAGASLSVLDSLAQSYPIKPIRMLIGFSPGAAPDVIARIMAPLFSEDLGQPLVVENRGGVGGSIATGLVAKSPADGYTLLMMAAADTLQPALRPDLPYDLERDIAPVSLVVTGCAVLTVHPSVPARSVKELVALARARPGELNFGSSGVGSSSHLMGELFNMMAEVKMSHVPYKGSADAAAATAAGQIEISFPSIASVGPFLDARKLRALAVTSARRNPLLPSLPTVSESGLPGYDRSTWFGVAAPAGVPKEIIARLHAEIGKIVGTPKIKALFNKQGLEPSPNTPEEFAAFIREQLATNAKVVAFSKAKSE